MASRTLLGERNQKGLGEVRGAGSPSTEAMKRTFVDFFAGIGLAEMGLHAAGWHCLFANDIDPKKYEMWKAQYRSTRKYKNFSIHELTASMIPEASLWWASFPCTDVSLAGYRAGLAGAQSGALLGVLRLLREKDGQRPPFVVLENVTGFISSHRGEDLDETIRQLNNIGYTCDAFTLDAIHFIPQSRPRLFIVGVYDQPAAKDVRTALSRRPAALKSAQLARFMAEDRQLSWCIFDIPDPPTPTTRLREYLEPLQDDSDYWWSTDRVQYLLAQMSDKHRAIIHYLTSREDISYATVYRRMRKNRSMAEVRADDIAGCLRTPRGGSSRQIVVAAGSGKVRARFMTPGEYASLMGAPKYHIEVSDNQAYFGFGDAVCVPVVKWIAQEVLNPLVEKRRESSDVTAAIA